MAHNSVTWSAILHQNLPLRIHRLETEIKLLGINDELVRKYNSTNRDLIQSIQSAARKVVGQKQHRHAQSPVLTQEALLYYFGNQY